MNDITPELCDLYPDLIRVVTPTLFRNFGGKRSFGGEIITIKCHEDNSLIKDCAATPGAGKVMLVDGGGSLRRALLGDMIAENALANGWEGIIIYGCLRDADAIATMDFGVQAISTIPLKTEKKGIGELNIPVTFGGLTFHPGDYVYADNNGVVVSAKKLTIPE